MLEEKSKEKFNCRKCSKEIDWHNQYCHDGMCDDCFFDIYFHEDAKPKSKDAGEEGKPEIILEDAGEIEER